MWGRRRPLSDKRTPKSRDPVVFLALVLAMAAAAVYAPVRGHDFIDFDDRIMFQLNPHMREGLSRRSLAWAVTAELTHDSQHANLWIPVTNISHLAAAQVFGLNPSGHHLVNLALHILNTVLLFLLFVRMTGAPFRSAFVAAVFGLHPLHVESVAWVAERKDVLSGLFWILAMRAYLAYVERPGVKPYLASAGLMVLGLMSKPMVVTFPLILLTMDLWPLGRAGDGSWPRWKPLIIEKLPLLAVCVLFSAVTVLASQREGVVASWEPMRVYVRFGNALVAYMRYIGKTLWPADLAVYYPHPGYGLPLWHVLAAAAALGGITALAIWTRRRRPYIAAGWFWYLVTLLPVIGLVQLETLAMADRYSYIPLIGLSAAVAWGSFEAAGRFSNGRTALGVAASLVAAVLAGCSFLQVRHWKDTTTLFGHTVRAVPDNFVAHNVMGIALARQGRLKEAEEHFSEAVRLRPRNPRYRNNLGQTLAEQGRPDEALPHFEEALKRHPSFGDAQCNMGVALAQKGRHEEAMGLYRKAMTADPDDPDPHVAMGLSLEALGRGGEAVERYREGARLRPDSAEVRFLYGKALAGAGRRAEAVEQISEGIWLAPRNAKLHQRLGLILAAEGRHLEALRPYSEALRLDPRGAKTLNSMGISLYELNRPADAARKYEAALKIDPEYAEALSNLGAALIVMGRYDAAVERIRAALKLDKENAKTRSSLGVAYLQMGRHADAAREFRAALKLDPGYGKAKMGLEIAEGKLGGG